MHSKHNEDSRDVFGRTLAKKQKRLAGCVVSVVSKILQQFVSERYCGFKHPSQF